MAKFNIGDTVEVDWVGGMHCYKTAIIVDYENGIYGVDLGEVIGNVTHNCNGTLFENTGVYVRQDELRLIKSVNPNKPTPSYIEALSHRAILDVFKILDTEKGGNPKVVEEIEKVIEQYNSDVVYMKNLKVEVD